MLKKQLFFFENPLFLSKILIKLAVKYQTKYSLVGHKKKLKLKQKEHFFINYDLKKVAIWLILLGFYRKLFFFRLSK